MSPKLCFVFVRVFYTALCVGIGLSFFVQDTSLRKALVFGSNIEYGLAYFCLLAASLALYFVTCYVDPGYLSTGNALQVHLEANEYYDPDGVDVRMQLMEDVRRHTCSYCQIYQPMRSHHCEDCRRCVRRFDHHCPCLETCIGERNHKWFLMYLMITLPLIWWSVSIAWHSILQTVTWPEWWHTNIVYVMTLVVLILCGIPMSGLFPFHVFLLLRGTTTWELLTHDRITYLRNLDNHINPFDEGILRNILSFFCSVRVRSWQTVYNKVVAKYARRAQVK